MLQFQSFLGLFFFTAVAYIFSSHKSKISWSFVGKALFLQLGLALLIIGVPALNFNGPVYFIFEGAHHGIKSLLAFSQSGAEFVIGSGQNMNFALAVFPTIIFFSSLMSILYHFGVLQKIVSFFSQLLVKSLKITGAESLSAVANVFIGQTEAPLMIKAYLPKLTRSELFVVMVSGMATIAGGVLAVYVGLLETRLENVGAHLLSASLISAPASLMIAKIFIPETEIPSTQDELQLHEKTSINFIDAAAEGASTGAMLCIHIGAMLLAFMALVYMLDQAAVSFTGLFIKEGVSFTQILGFLFQPFAFFLGIQWKDMALAGKLIGEKIVLNEFIAYAHLAENSATISDRSALILSYALCGFANFGSIGIQIAGIGGLVPERKSEIAALGLKAVLGGSLAAFLTACWAGILIG